jgi:uncharacterized protein YdhG (YjbR/CyaY superfamily)
MNEATPTTSTTPGNIDEYISRYPDDIQAILQKIRTTIREAAPDAVETISYQMPTFKFAGKYLVYFAAHKNHIGLYPTPGPIQELNAELAPYEAGKGSLRFPLDKPIPYHLITKVVEVRMAENLAQAEAKRAKRKKK